jgi:DNA-directed RNA polymerase beta subunit
MIRIAEVKPGDILIGKITPRVRSYSRREIASIFGIKQVM